MLTTIEYLIQNNIIYVVCFILGYCFCFFRNGVARQMSALLTLHLIVERRIRLILGEEYAHYCVEIAYYILMEHISCLIYKKRTINSESLVSSISKLPEYKQQEVLSYCQKVNDVLQKEVKRAYLFASINKLVNKVEKLGEEK